MVDIRCVVKLIIVCGFVGFWLVRGSSYRVYFRFVSLRFVGLGFL